MVPARDRFWPGRADALVTALATLRSSDATLRREPVVLAARAERERERERSRLAICKTRVIRGPRPAFILDLNRSVHHP
jgi:hypothetical protein